ncbi:tyrosine-type recombinase/integrase [Azospirillum argentinense]|uniref:DUF4102 domain-containing protein n=1 Tax=Azospirillum brasilense TaxID=192 RepID=A0A4D8Q7Z3_AZOBR|nr:site-specific integrase [Azospirillum argentinense]QCO05423.1 DUF4102 domain-containing protein [Azospirillum argentinense]
MPKVKLNAKVVENARTPVPGVQLDLFDASLPAFGLRVGDRRKTWFVIYRFGGKQKRLTLGHYPALSLGDARIAAGKALDAVDAGRDPAAERETSAKPVIPSDGFLPGSFGALANLYITQACPHLRRGDEVEASITNNIVSVWRDKPVAELRRRDLTALIDPIVASGMRAKAHKVREQALCVMNWAVDRGDIEANLIASPSRGRRRVDPLRYQPRDRVLAPDELTDIWHACDELKGPLPYIVKILMLTGQRRDEVSGMRRAELDLEAGLWTIPSDRYKTGIAHIVPITPAVKDLLGKAPSASKEFVFATIPDSAFCGYSYGKKTLDRKIAERRTKAGLPEMPRWTFHDLRRTLRTGLSELRINSDVAERVLGHVIGGVVGIYDRHAYLDEKRDALERWAVRVAEIVGRPAGREEVVADAVPF